MRIVVTTGRICQLLLGLVFLVAGAAKVWEPILFYWQALPFVRLLPIHGRYDSAVAQAVLLVAPLEFALGLALVANWRPKWTFALGALLLSAFLAITAQAWRLGLRIDCGCFGWLVDRSPGQAAAEDGLMLVLLAFAFCSTRTVPAPLWKRAPQLVLIGFSAALVVGAWRFVPARDRIGTSDLHVGLRLGGLRVYDLERDLTKGQYLVALFSPTCKRCRREVARFNRWSAAGGLPEIIGLCSFRRGSRTLQQFKRRLQPRYRIGSISKVDFARLTWKHRYPRLIYVHGGVVRKVWEYNELPGPERLRRAIQQRATPRPRISGLAASP